MATIHSPPPPFSSTSPTTPPPTVLTQGAEAIVYKTVFLTPSTPCALKYRPVKTWRHPILDRRLTKQRLLAEARTLTKCRKEGIQCPAVLGADWEAGWIALEWIEGHTIRVCLDRFLNDGNPVVSGQELSQRSDRDAELWDLMARVGRSVGRLHQIGVCHGDLTTSNLMLRPPSTRHCDVESGGALASLAGDVVMIDFGLASQLVQDEDRAVDLYVLERAFGSTHPAAEPLFGEVLRAYGESFKGAKMVLRRLEDVRMRGRKRSMVG